MVANVTPIFNEGFRWDQGNYRPISLTSGLGKLEENITYPIMNNLEESALLKENQAWLLQS